jgi:hypothetical protein
MDSEATNHPDLSEPVKKLLCCCCGARTKGRQWHNRDTGYGICSDCVAWVRGRGTNAADIRSNYGIEGIHWGDLAC